MKGECKFLIPYEDLDVQSLTGDERNNFDVALNNLKQTITSKLEATALQEASGPSKNLA